MSGDAHVQFWEGLGVRLPGAITMERLVKYVSGQGSNRAIASLVRRARWLRARHLELAHASISLAAPSSLSPL